MKLVEKDTIIDSQYIYVVGRIRSEFELIQSGTLDSGDNAECSILLNKRADTEPVFKDVKDRVYFDTNINEYFVIKMPREDFYIVSLVFMISNSALAQINTNIKIEVPEEDSFIYIGDLVLFMENDQVFIRNEADFDSCRALFFDYLKDKQKKYLSPVDRSSALYTRVRLRMWHEEVWTSSAYINGRWQTNSYGRYILDYEL